MRKLLFLIFTIIAFSNETLFAQRATVSLPFSIGRNNCGGSGTNDSLYFFSYISPNLTRATYPLPYRPKLKIGPASTTQRFSIFAASIAFNPADQKTYYLWTDYSNVIRPTGTWTYIWRWRTDTTFSAANTPTSVYIDTIRSYPYDIGGIAFDRDGTAWTLEFPAAPCSRAFLRPMNFLTGAYNSADTLDLLPGAGGIGDTLWSPGNGDITLLPGGQMYFNFDNKLYTPDYSSYGGATHHLKATYIDTTRLPTSATSLVGLAYSDGDLIAAYARASYTTTSCTYRRMDPVTGDTNFVSYSYTSGVRSTDMTQLISGVGASKRLISVTPTGTANQYDVVYEVYTKNYGSVPVTNIMVKDSLSSINGAANVSNVSTSFVGTPPPGIVLNAAFNGTTNANLINAGATLKNYPVDSSYFTIRINVRLSNIQSGIIYNNSAIVTANGFNNVALRDSSTNGSNPDLNQNDKPDDLGEGQPTPFIITITPTTPPCSVLSQVLLNQDFGTGVGMSATYPTTAITTYAGTTTAPMPVNRFTVTDSSHRGDPTNWLRLRDHTGNANGRMLVVNADAPANIIYRDTMPVSCPGQQYSFSFWTVFIGNSTYQTLCNGLGGFKYPRFLIRARDLATGLVITQFTTDSIASTTWVQRGTKWVMPSGYTNILMEIINAGAGGCGNDFAIDDIQYGICDAAPTVSVTSVSGCIGGTATFTSTLSDTLVIPGAKQYQWQWSPAPGAGPWTNIGGATAATYVINPVNAIDTGRYYRVIVAANGNIGIAQCQYISNGLRLAGLIQSSSTGAVASRNKNNICPGITVGLSVTGGTLGTNAKWKWYTGACGTTLIDSGASINVTPTVTTTYYVRAEGTCNTTACVSITVNISCDIDKDDDGIPDMVESNMALALQDANSNGIINAYDPTYGGYKDNNNDYINDDFQADGDSDNDGIANYLDATFPGRVDANLDGVDDRFDMDRDGIINMLDLDSDNDGVPDVVEAWGVDANGNAKIDNYTDTDNDGLSDNVDTRIVASNGAYNTGVGLGNIDLDGDGVPNYLDLDSDQDGIPDVLEALGPDTNNDGKADGFVDANADGLNDNYINGTALLITGSDGNSDGRADTWPNKNMDQDLRPNAYDMDADGDGVIDVIEAGLPDADLNGRVDGTIGANGWSTTVSGMSAPLAIRSTDADGKPDYRDIDSDDDGIPDNIEGQTTAGYLLPGTTDSDGDGLVDTYDNVVGFGGSGIFLYDHDGDGTPDVRDLDTDADGQPDRVEGNDYNLNGTADDLVTLTGLDTDGDGLDNRYDSLNSTTNIKGTSYMMGNGGSTSGDATPGTRAPVQKQTVGQLDRDWRFVGIVLPVQFLNFTGVALANNVNLNWTIITAKEIDRFEVERSTDNTVYGKVGIVKQPVLLNQPQNFGFVDDISNVNSEIIYYRLKVIGKANEIKYSNVLVVRRVTTKTPVTIMPNPANDFISVRFFAEKESDVTIKMMDNLGKTVFMQKQKVSKGNNTIQLNSLTRYQTGVYNLQVFVNDDITTTKLILTH